MSTFEIKSLADISFEDFFKTNMLAFAHYPSDLDQDAGLLKRLFQRNGVDFANSWGSFANGRAKNRIQ